MDDRSRILPLDAIRGGLAFGVMGFHVAAWAGVGLFTTLGTYWVYAFFVLSGFALEHVYGGRLASAADVGRFLLARFARIAPLFFVATALTVIALVVGSRPVEVAAVIANLTGVFGLWQPGASQVAEGAWSLGIEAVFYLIFPVLVLLRLRTPWLAVLAVAALALRLAWVENVWPDGANFGTTWAPYTVVPSFVVFFVAGMLAARVWAAAPRARTWPPLVGAIAFLIGAAILLAIAWTSTLDLEQRDYFAGPFSIALTLATCVAVAIAAFGPAWVGWPARAATWLGDTSYATYLLHPLIWGVLALAGLGPWTLVVAPVLGLAVHRWFERPAQRWIRSLGRRSGRGVPAPEPGAVSAG